LDDILRRPAIVSISVSLLKMRQQIGVEKSVKGFLQLFQARQQNEKAQASRVT